MRNIILIGMMGSGKSSVGDLISKRLSLRFIDTDSLVSKRLGEDIFNTFSRSEEHFRSIEREVIDELVTLEERSVVATGGGTVTIKNGVEILKSLGQTLYLKASPIELTRRLMHSKIRRPLLGELTTYDELLGSIEAILASRHKLYELSETTISTDGLTLNEVCDKILSKLLIFP